MALVALDLQEANDFVHRHHRHHKPVVGHKFSIGAALDNHIVGVAIVGRPVARLRDDGETLEVTRLCTDGTRNACSFLYGAAARAALALGYKRIGTYILASETGATLRASGWRQIGEVKGRSWTTPSRPRVDRHPLGDKLLFQIELPRIGNPLKSSKSSSGAGAAIIGLPAQTGEVPPPNLPGAVSDGGAGRFSSRSR